MKAHVNRWNLLSFCPQVVVILKGCTDRWKAPQLLATVWQMSTGSRRQGQVGYLPHPMTVLIWNTVDSG